MASTPPPEGAFFPGAPSAGPFTRPAQHATQRAPAPTVAPEDVPRLLAALRQQVRSSLSRYHYDNARFYAERLFELESSYHHLHLLAHTYTETGGDLRTAANQLLELHYPFFPLEANQVLSPHFLTRIQASFPHAGRGDGDGHSRRADSVDLLSLDDEPSALQRQSPPAAAAAVVVDVASRWWCQYLFAVTCAQKERFREGAKVLAELRVVSTVLQSAFGPASLNAAEETATSETSGTRLTGALAALYAQDSLVDFFANMEERLADVDYWLGYCSTRFFQRQDTSEYFFTSARRDPTLIAAFDRYTQHMREAPSNCVEDLFSDDAFNRVLVRRPGAAVDGGSSLRLNEEAEANNEDKQSPHAPLRRSVRRDPVDARTFPASASAAPVLSSSSTSPLNAFLRSHARVLYLQRTYRCTDVLTALDALPTLGAVSTAAHPLPGARTSTAWSESRSAYVWLQRGLAWFHAGRMEESAAAFDHAVRGAPWRLDDRALIYYSTALWQLRDVSRLGSLAQFLLDKTPFSAVTLCVVANTYSLSKMPHDAVAMLERASHVDQTLAYAHCLRGYELLALGQRDAASEAFKAALTVDPRHYMAFAGIGERCLRDEQLPEARNCFRLAIEINPLPAIMNRLTATYHRSDATHKELTDALVIYERTIAQHPHNSFAALHQRADVLLRLGRVQEAYTSLLALQRQRPSEAVVQVTLARCLQCMGDTQGAILHFHRAMELDPRREGYVRCALERIASDASAGTA